MNLDRLVDDVTKHALAEISLAGPGLEQLAVKLRDGAVDPEWYRELSAGLAWLQDLLELIETLGRATPTRSVELSRERAEVFTRSRAILQQIVEAQQHKDHLFLADLVQYELKPLLMERIGPMLPRFNGMAAS